MGTCVARPGPSAGAVYGGVAVAAPDRHIVRQRIPRTACSRYAHLLLPVAQGNLQPGTQGGDKAVPLPAEVAARMHAYPCPA